ncbi:cbb3-type cytochrome c oxidase subunit I [Ferruginibacter sp.]|nr:cbb3-type cytochrome c oxidase subunit I [Ferruginibacter sp.]
MAPSNSKQEAPSRLFIIAALLLLGTGMFWGVTGGLQYLIPGFLKSYLPFQKIRPLHVSSVVFWIIFSSTGAVFTYLQQHTGKKIYSQLLIKIQLIIFSLSVIAILISYCAGIFGGREYWEFHPILALPIVAGWILFLINFIKSARSFRNQPVYVWMWFTGMLFFLFTFLESYLWIFPYFRNNVVNDMTVQWKSYGAMVGSWNMLIYGSSIFLMDKISNSKNYSHSSMAFLLYFIGLFNLMFNWGHHIYTLPTHNYIKHISYAISMTELFILGRIIFNWRASVSAAKKNFHKTAYRFLVAADAWIFLTLLLAIIMSVPGINLYTHGTHITVAHTMGATIGINSFLLLAIAFDILNDTCLSFEPYKKLFNRGYWLANISLFVFWISLIGAGVVKAKWQLSTSQIPFSSMMLQLRPFFIVFFISGVVMMTGFLCIIYPLLKNNVLCYFKFKTTGKIQTHYYSPAA